jgi:hypothetical protein
MSKVEEQGGTYNPKGMPERAATTVTGKPKLAEGPAEKAANENRDHLYDAIARLSDFIDGFSNIASEEFKISPEAIADQTEEMKSYRIGLLKRKNKETEEILSLREKPAELYERQCTQKEVDTPNFNRKQFAASEKKRAQAAYRRFEEDPELDDYYKENPKYILVRGYIMYLDEILGQNQPDLPSAALKPNYTKKQLGQIFDNCYNRGLTKKKDKEKFISIFTIGLTGLVHWEGTKEHGAKRALFDIMYRITERSFLPSEIIEYFELDEPLKPHDRVITKRGIPHTNVGNKIFAGIHKK